MYSLSITHSPQWTHGWCCSELHAAIEMLTVHNCSDVMNHSDKAVWLGVRVVICIYQVVVLRFLGSLGCQGYAEIVMKSWQEYACFLRHSPQSHAPHKVVALTTWFNDEILPYNYLWKTDTSIGESSKQSYSNLTDYFSMIRQDTVLPFEKGKRAWLYCAHFAITVCFHAFLMSLNVDEGDRASHLFK